MGSLFLPQPVRFAAGVEGFHKKFFFVEYAGREMV
jgi:hypothetical protein